MINQGNKPKSLYLHVPFCKTICFYCDFCHTVYNRRNAENWLVALQKEIAGRDINKSLDTILGEKANSTDVPSKVSQLKNDTGFITNAALANYPNNTQMNAAINSHHDSSSKHIKKAS